MNKDMFKALSENEQKQVVGGKLPGGSHGTITGWRFYQGQYYVDIQYASGEPSCEVPWNEPNPPQIGDTVG